VQLKIRRNSDRVETVPVVSHQKADTKKISHARHFDINDLFDFNYEEYQPVRFDLGAALLQQRQSSVIPARYELI
jgi:hypothetical protein